MKYLDFLKSKMAIATDSGFDVLDKKINTALKPHQRDIVKWAVKGGKRAVFAKFGLGKSVIQLEWCTQVIVHEGGKALIICPLGVKQEFVHDAVEILGYDAPTYVKTMAEVRTCSADIMITNYERVRDGDIDVKYFTATSLDEAAVLRSFGSKTYQEFLKKFNGVPYKLVATATPDPNKYKELIHYAGYLEIMDTGQALTRFFQRDSTKANNLTLYPHKEEEFWLWVSSWAVFVSKSSDVNPTYSDEGYDLPELKINYHRLAGKGLTMQEVVEAAEAMPMMAEHTLVTVEDMDLFRLDEAQRGALVALLEDFPEYCTLVFLYRQIPYKTDAKLKKLTAALAERAQVIEFAQQGQQKLQKWVRRRFAAAGKDIDAGTVDHLLFTCGSLMTGLVPEIAKIAAYARGPKITAADIDAVADPVLDARVFDMTDAVAARDYDKAAECLAELLRMQEEPIRILAALGKTLRQLYTARLAIDGGKDVLWLKDLWRMKSDYPAKKLMQSARGVRRSWCREAVKRCQTLDHRMKSERNMDNEGELKLFLMELAGVK